MGTGSPTHLLGEDGCRGPNADRLWVQAVGDAARPVDAQLIQHVGDDCRPQPAGEDEPEHEQVEVPRGQHAENVGEAGLLGLGTLFGVAVDVLEAQACEHDATGDQPAEMPGERTVQDAQARPVDDGSQNIADDQSNETESHHVEDVQNSHRADQAQPAVHDLLEHTSVEREPGSPGEEPTGVGGVGCPEDDRGQSLEGGCDDPDGKDVPDGRETVSHRLVGVERGEEARSVRPPAEQEVQPDDHREGGQGLPEVRLGHAPRAHVE